MWIKVGSRSITRLGHSSFDSHTAMTKLINNKVNLLRKAFGDERTKIRGYVCIKAIVSRKFAMLFIGTVV
jgi:hypothetical protein